jgi:glycosyltransferase involved in cell wall biosynthesis
VKVAYLIPFRFAENNGQHARMNDIFDTFEEQSPPFNYRVFSLISDDDLTLSSLGFGVKDIWGSRWHNVESMLSFGQVSEAINRYDPDILHVTAASPAEIMLTKLTVRQLDLTVVLGPHLGGWYPVRRAKFWSGGISSALSRLMTKIIKSTALYLNDPDKVLTFSEYHELMIRSIWNKHEQIEIIPPAVHSRFCPDPDVERDIDLLYVGSLNKQKGYDKFMKALHMIDGNRDLRVVVLGGTPKRNPTFETIDVQYLGFKPRYDLPSYYNRSKLFVCLSSDEMGPNTLVEALSCGTPALVSDEIGIREYLRSGNGMVCNRENINNVATVLRECLNNERDLLDSAAEAAHTYDIERTIDWLDHIYKEAL